MTLPEKEDAQSELVFTGERFIPRQTDPLLALEHYHRYYFASRFAENKRILDIACGEGYGSALLSKSAGEVVGIDIDEVTIEHARTRYSPIANLRFEVGRCEDGPKDAAGFDMVVSFELLEHLDPGDQVSFLRNVQRVMKQDGIFVISSPERYEYAATYQTRNEFHKHELTLLELKSFLGAFFKHVYLCAQRVLFVSTMWQLEKSRDAQFLFHSRKDLLDEIPSNESLAQPLYLIALCSNAPIPDDVIAECNSFYLDISNSDQTKSFSRWALQLNAEAQKNRGIIQDLQREREYVQHQLEEGRNQLEEYRHQLEERTAWAMGMDGQIKGKDELIGTLKNEMIEMVKGELDSRAKWAFSLEAELTKERGISKQLNEVQARLSQQLTAITSSFIYRLLARVKLLPKY
jgi:SAM-dependent methyltransferase